jgi:hypothetical protein
VDLPGAVAVAIGVIATVALAVGVAATVRQVKVLSRATRAFGDAVEPALRVVRERSEEAQARARALAERREQLFDRRERPTR